MNEAPTGGEALQAHPVCKVNGWGPRGNNRLPRPRRRPCWNLLEWVPGVVWAPVMSFRSLRRDQGGDAGSRFSVGLGCGRKAGGGIWCGVLGCAQSRAARPATGTGSRTQHFEVSQGSGWQLAALTPPPSEETTNWVRGRSALATCPEVSELWGLSPTPARSLCVRLTAEHVGTPSHPGVGVGAVTPSWVRGRVQTGLRTATM